MIENRLFSGRRGADTPDGTTDGSEIEKLDIIQDMMPNSSFCSLNNKVARKTEFQWRGTNYSLYFKLTLRTIPHLAKEVEQGTK